MRPQKVEREVRWCTSTGRELAEDEDCDAMEITQEVWWRIVLVATRNGKRTREGETHWCDGTTPQEAIKIARIKIKQSRGFWTENHSNGRRTS